MALQVRAAQSGRSWHRASQLFESRRGASGPGSLSTVNRRSVCTCKYWVISFLLLSVDDRQESLVASLVSLIEELERVPPNADITGCFERPCRELL
jgi:hypothetical protein